MARKTQEYDEKVVELRKSGKKYKEIADILGIRETQAKYIGKLYGLMPKREETSPYCLYGKDILDMWDSGLTKRQIANTLGLTLDQVKSIIKRHSKTSHDNHDTNVWLEKLKQELQSYGYEYISGYKRYNSIIRIKDLSNGIEYNVNCHNFIQRKRNNKISEHYEPDRNKKITLRGLYKMFNGVCYICGEKCDFSDWWINENGTRCFGGKYPSIEHKIPRSRNGKTQWGNVLLAHRNCNSKKHTMTEEEANIEVCI